MEDNCFFLTADHCGQDSHNWVLLFRYESLTCETGIRHLNYTVSGLKVLARNAHTDVVLAEVQEEIPADYHVFLSGFDAQDQPEQRFTCGIHHPRGDMKKISFSHHPTTSANWRSAEHHDTHWKIHMWTNGTTEPGSSGSPLFNSRHLIVGQLTGGSASCYNPQGYDIYGKLARSWDIGVDSATRLKDHLDPPGTGRIVEGMPLIRRPRLSERNDCKYSCSFLSKKNECEKACQM